MISMKHSIFKLIFLLLPVFIGSCRKEEHPIPYVPVNITLYVSDPEFVNLNAVGGSTYLRGGSRGILVYRKSQDEFMAYDRHCTNEPDNPKSIVIIDPGNSFSAVDTTCTSSFLLIDGTVQKGPAHIPLKQYQTFFDDVSLTITN